MEGERWREMEEEGMEGAETEKRGTEEMVMRSARLLSKPESQKS